MKAHNPLIYFGVWLALLGLLALTLLCTYLPFGRFQFAIAMLIAASKAFLVGWYFMHLREQNVLIRIFACGALFWLAIAGILTLSDYLTRIEPLSQTYPLQGTQIP